MKKARKALVLILTVIMTLSIAACGGPNSSNNSSAETTNDTLNVGLSADPMNLDPNDNNSQHSQRVKTQIYETLVARDADGKLTGGLAESWEWADDTTIIFHIRQGVKFHNGDELTAEDVKFSLERIASMGAAKVAVSHVDLEKCEATDKYTYKMVLKDAYTPQIAWLEWPLTAITCEKSVKESNDDFMASPNGTGPYKLSNWISGDRVELVANEDYWGGAPAIKNLNMIIVTESANRAIMLETGELDVAYDISSADYDRIANGSDTSIVKSPSHNTNYIGMSCLFKPFNDVRVRQAVAYAVDVPACYQAAYNGVHELSTGFVDPEVDGYAKETFPSYDPEKSKKLLAEAGYPDGFTCDFYTNNDAERVALAEAVQGNLADVGIKTNIVTLEMGAYSGIIDNNTLNGIFLLGATCTTVEAEKILADFVSTAPGSINTSGYRNSDFDALLEKAVTTMDEKTRWDIYKQCFDILTNDMPWVPTFDKQQLTGIRKNVQGYANGSFECARFKTCHF
ncbi:MAG: ABC transporter substrate-binding protein [Intestinimonas sp.]|jgi:peptide/nickel transport system substrate-binding protein|nr:ABC transporter substrate-binding protein [Intestinimonas sp.]